MVGSSVLVRSRLSTSVQPPIANFPDNPAESSNTIPGILLYTFLSANLPKWAVANVMGNWRVFHSTNLALVNCYGRPYFKGTSTPLCSNFVM